MPILKTARADILQPSTTITSWTRNQRRRTASVIRQSILAQATEIFGKPFNPEEYILSHATIVCSVDTEIPPRTQTGTLYHEGRKVLRKFADYRVTKNTEKYINDNFDCFSRGVILKSYRTFVGAFNFLEHCQIPEQSKGRIIDAVLRDMGDSLYVDILVATERKHTALCEDILSGKMNAMSMGCLADFTICTKCGNVAYDEAELCNCIRNEKGSYYSDENGEPRLVAEICGHASLDPVGGNQFIEGSWVGLPAFKGAVLRSLIGTAGNQEVHTPVEESFASFFNPALSRVARRKKRAEDDFGFGDEDMGDDEPNPPSESEDKKGPWKDLEDKVYDKLMKQVRQRVDREMEDDESKASDDPGSVSAPNDTLQKNALVLTAKNDLELMEWVARMNQASGKNIPQSVYRVALKIGSTSSQEDWDRKVCPFNVDPMWHPTLLGLGRLLNLHTKRSTRT